jgi:hypothetical protein
MTEFTAMHRVPTRDQPTTAPRPSLRPFLVGAMTDDTEFVVVADDLTTVRDVVNQRRAMKRLPPGIPTIQPLGGRR